MRTARAWQIAQAHQQGAATLFIGIMFLLASGLLTLGIVRVGVLEQRMANNEVRAKEAQQAAQAAIEYAIAWLGTNAWGPDTRIPETLIQPAQELGAFGEYAYRTRVEIRDDGDCLHLQADAFARAEEEITATISECVSQIHLLRSVQSGAAEPPPQRSQVDLPPLIVNGCVAGSTPGAAVEPRACDASDESAPCPATAILSSAPSSCLDVSGMGLNGGQVLGSAFEGSAWSQVFGIGMEEFARLADTPHGPLQRLSGTLPPETPLGSAEAPVFIWFDPSEGCPRLDGIRVIHGILYVGPGAQCSANDWGMLTLVGALVFDGTLGGLGAGIRIQHWSLAQTDGDRAPLNLLLGARRWPGSWRDWRTEP